MFLCGHGLRGSGGVIGGVGLLLTGSFLGTPAPGHPGPGRGAVPIKSWAQMRWDPGCLPTAGSGAGPPEEQGLDQYLLSEGKNE